MDGYQVGKDIGNIISKIELLEKRLESLEKKVGCGCSDTTKLDWNLVPLPSGAKRHTHNDAQRIVESTKAFLASKLKEDELTGIDFSYITPQLLDYYAAFAKDKDLPTVTEEGKAAFRGSCYYGHHFTHNGANANYMNSNDQAGCDRPQDRCFGTNPWSVTLSTWRTTGGLECPRNSQGYASTTFEGS